MKIVTKEFSGFASAVYDMRKPMESEGDSDFEWGSSGLTLNKLGTDDQRLLKKLGGAKSGSGHDCVLKSITIHADFTMPHDFVLQYYRYTFRDTTSSTSKMHCIHKGDISAKCGPYVSWTTINLVNQLIRKYNATESILSDWDYQVICGWLNPDKLADRQNPRTKKELFECIIANTPIGYMLTYGEVLNYLQLKTMWKQRKNHKMSSWNTIFVDWVRSLPHSYLITGEE